jgi:hypothetical protein
VTAHDLLWVVRMVTRVGRGCVAISRLGTAWASWWLGWSRRCTEQSQALLERVKREYL